MSKSIERNPDREATLLAALKESFDEPREGVHLSTLMSVRSSYYASIVPLPLTETQVGYFASGRALEDVVARLVGIDVGAVPAQRVSIPGLIAGEQRFYAPDGTVRGAAQAAQVNEISYRPDFRWDGVPVEFKSRRAEFAKPGTEAEKYDNYLEQLKGYCAFDRINQGGLYLFDIGGGCTPALGHADYYTREPSFAYYDVLFNDDELERMRAELGQRRDQYLAAKAVGTVKAGWTLPLCAPWKCGKNRKHITTPAKCAAPGCDVKHRVEKAGHMMSPAVAQWEYTPRCPHYNFSRPELVDAQRGPRA